MNINETPWESKFLDTSDIRHFMLANHLFFWRCVCTVLIFDVAVYFFLKVVGLQKCVYVHNPSIKFVWMRAVFLELATESTPDPS